MIVLLPLFSKTYQGAICDELALTRQSPGDVVISKNTGNPGLLRSDSMLKANGCNSGLE